MFHNHKKKENALQQLHNPNHEVCDKYSADNEV